VTLNDQFEIYGRPTLALVHTPCTPNFWWATEPRREIATVAIYTYSL